MVMKCLGIVLDYTQKAIIGLLFLPLVAIAILVGLFAFICEWIAKARIIKRCPLRT